MFSPQGTPRTSIKALTVALCMACAATHSAAFVGLPVAESFRDELERLLSDEGVALMQAHALAHGGMLGRRHHAARRTGGGEEEVSGLSSLHSGDDKGGDTRVAAPPRTLLVVTTQNVWPSTLALLVSLAAAPDPLHLLVVDECSSDETRAELAKHARSAGDGQVHVLHVNDTKGVTHDWNLAYEYFLNHPAKYEYLVYSNNDVLVPPGVLEKLVQPLEAGECDLVSPISTMDGKGHVGEWEGLEVVFNLSKDGQVARKAASPFHYVHVQQALDITFDREPPPLAHMRGEFNGFFFALPRRIHKAAAAPDTLFSSSLFSFKQENDLSERMDKLGMKRCLHVGAFVYHAKGATIPMVNRDMHSRSTGACDLFNEQQQQQDEQQQQDANL